jgi:outer membrane protein TolC
MKKIVAFGLLPFSIYASALSFDEALKEAFNNNNELKAKKLSIDVAKQNLKEAKSYDWGKLVFKEQLAYTNNALNVFGFKLQSREAGMADFGIGFDNNGNMIFDKDALNNPDARFNALTTINYQIPLFTGFKLKYAKEMAKLQVKANEFKYKRDKNSLAIEVLKAYNGAVAAKEFIKALKIAKKTTESFVEMTKNLNDQGMIVKSDLLSAQSRDIDVKAKLIEADSQYKLALAYLKFLTGKNDITDVESFKVIISPEKKLASLQEESLNNRNDLKWMKSNLTTMQTKVKMDSSDTYPMVGAQIEYGFNDDNIMNISGDKDYYLMGVELSYNIFDGYKKQAIKEKAKIEAKKVGYYYTHMQNGIKMDVEQKYLDLKAKSAVIEEKITNKDLAEQILSQYTSMYKNGLINISILLLKEAEMQKARAELIKAKYDQALSAANLQLSVGSLNVVKKED